MHSQGAAFLDDAWKAAMLEGDFERAWQATDNWEEERRHRVRQISHPNDLLWDGQDWADRHLVIRCLHGLGDSIQFSRFIPKLAKRAGRITVLMQPDLIPLFRGVAGFDEVRDVWKDYAIKGDVEMEIMETAYTLRLLLCDLPGNVPVLRHPGACSAFGRCSDSREFKVGLIWQSSGWDRCRSLPAGHLSALAMDRVVFYSFQQGTEIKPSLPCIDRSAWTRRILELAAALSELDLFITVDTMAAHLAGTLGVPTWLLLQYHADWRWMCGRSDSPWYPSMRIFRQEQPGHWQAPLDQVRDALGCLVPEKL